MVADPDADECDLKGSNVLLIVDMCTTYQFLE